MKGTNVSIKEIKKGAFCPLFLWNKNDYMNREGECIISKEKENLPLSSAKLCALVQEVLEDKKALDIVVLDLVEKASFTDYMVIATGQSARQVGAMAEALESVLKEHKVSVHVEGFPQCDWVLVDAFDVVIHLFRPEVRAHYNLEKMWSVELPEVISTLRQRS